MYALQCGDYEDVISWTNNGISFVITDARAFTKRVLPALFKLGQFESFQRKLARWGFVKRRGVRGAAQTRSFGGFVTLTFRGEASTSVIVWPAAIMLSTRIYFRYCPHQMLFQLVKINTLKAWRMSPVLLYRPGLVMMPFICVKDLLKLPCWSTATISV